MRLWLGLMCTVSLGCGPSVGGDGGGTDESGGQDSASGSEQGEGDTHRGDEGAGADSRGTSATTGVVTQSGSGTAAESGGDATATGGDVCEGFHDETPPPQDLPVTVRNASGQPLFVQMRGECDVGHAFALTWPTLPEQQAVVRRGLCSSCSGAIEGACVCPGIACGPPAVLKLEPGAEYIDGWSGVLYVGRTLPDECVGPGGGCSPSCQQAVIAAAGAYDFTVRFGDGVGNCEGLDCECDAGTDGWCLIQSGADLTVENGRDLVGTEQWPGDGIELDLAP